MHCERLQVTSAEWDKMREGFPDRTIFQTSAWLAFVAETQRAEPVLAALKEGARVLGYFAGLIVHRLGLRILGSPLPGWTTSYMGFNLQEGLDRKSAAEALVRFAFAEMHCVHLEFMDRQLPAEGATEGGFEQRPYTSFEIDLRQSEEQLLAHMTHQKRGNLKKSLRCGLVVEQANEVQFADDYYAQLRQVFARQSLVPTYDVERVRALIRHLQPTGKLLLLRARDREGRCIATSISMGINRTAHLWGAASLREYQILRPNELLTWQVMGYWKQQGMQTLDLTGNGEYKKWYGATRIQVPWLRKSRHPLFSHMRNSAREFFLLKQRLAGKWNRHAVPAGAGAEVELT